MQLAVETVNRRPFEFAFSSLAPSDSPAFLVRLSDSHPLKFP